MNQRMNTATSAANTQLGTPKHKLKIKSSSICARAPLPVPPTCLAISGRVKFSTGAPVRRGEHKALFLCGESGPAVTLGSRRAETTSFTASTLPDANWRQARYSKLAEPDASFFQAMGALG